MPYAKLNVPVEVPKVNLSDLVAPEDPEKQYIGPNIDWAKVPGILMDLLTLADPSGMIGGPAGFVWNAPKSAAWMKKGPDMSESLFEALRSFGAWLENQFPRMAKSTKNTPVSLLELSPKNDYLGQYISHTLRPNKPYGLIEVVRDPEFPHSVYSTLEHEAIHRSRDVDPLAKELSRILWESAPEAAKGDIVRQWANPYNLKDLYPREYLSILGGNVDTFPHLPPSHIAAVKALLTDPKASGVREILKKAGLQEELASLGKPGFWERFWEGDKMPFSTEEIRKVIQDEQRRVISTSSHGVTKSKTASAREIPLESKPEAAKEAVARRKRVKEYVPEEGGPKGVSIEPVYSSSKDAIMAEIDDIVKDMKNPTLRAKAVELLIERLMPK